MQSKRSDRLEDLTRNIQDLKQDGMSEASKKELFVNDQSENQSSSPELGIPKKMLSKPEKNINIMNYNI